MERPPSPRTVAALALLGLALALPGCLEPEVEESAESDEYVLTGQFAPDATDEDLEEVRQRVGPTGAVLLVSEGLPLQYQVRPLNANECERVAEWLAQRPYVESVSECRRGVDVLREDAPAADEPWWAPEEDQAASAP